MVQEYVDEHTDTFRLDIASTLESPIGLNKYVFFASNNDAFDLLENKDLLTLGQWNTILMRHLGRNMYIFSPYYVV